MRIPLKNRYLLLFFTTALIFILIYISSQSELSDQDLDDINSIQSKTHSENSEDTYSTSSKYKMPPNQEDDMCEACHGEFVPFDVELEIPNNVEEGEEFQLDIIVNNKDGDKEHDVENLEAMITGLSGEPQQPYFNVIPGILLRFQVEQASFPVNELANEVIITLTGDSGLMGLNNIDLALSSPEGQSWSSTGSGVDEEIVLNFNDILEGGFGNYNIEVSYVNGVGQISYSIYIDVKYTASDLVKFGGDLKEGASHTFTWDLTLTNEELENLGSEVSGTISYTHDDGYIATHRYTVIVDPEAVIVQNGEVSTFIYLNYGRALGFLALFSLAIVALTGYSPGFRKKISKLMRFKNPQNFHCFVSIAIILFALGHAGLLIKSHYALGATPNLFGAAGLTIFGILAVTGFYRQKLFPTIGVKNWKRFHLVLAIAMLLIITYKILSYGQHF